ncbi:MAG: VOC family protein [Candidatus Limnocylindria bacterium]
MDTRVRPREYGSAPRDALPGSGQILLEDPSGNPIELFQPARRA